MQRKFNKARTEIGGGKLFGDVKDPHAAGSLGERTILLDYKIFRPIKVVIEQDGSTDTGAKQRVEKAGDTKTPIDEDQIWYETVCFCHNPRLGGVPPVTLDTSFVGRSAPLPNFTDIAMLNEQPRTKWRKPFSHGFRPIAIRIYRYDCKPSGKHVMAVEVQRT